MKTAKFQTVVGALLLALGIFSGIRGNYFVGSVCCLLATCVFWWPLETRFSSKGGSRFADTAKTQPIPSVPSALPSLRGSHPSPSEVLAYRRKYPEMGIAAAYAALVTEPQGARSEAAGSTFGVTQAATQTQYGAAKKPNP